MARISATLGPSNNDVTKETPLLTKQGKLDTTSNPVEWHVWKIG